MTPLLCDEMLGRLARWLRLLGLDVAYLKGVHDDVLAEAAKREGRVLVTRDEALAARVPGSILVRSLDAGAQLREVLARLGPVDPALRMSRCSLCNSPLAALPREAAEGKVPDAVWASQREYWRCPTCDRIYWRGTHAEAIEAVLRELAERGP